MDKGARFFRADLQVHTPRDAQWNGPRPSTEEERAAWARSLIAACRNVGLDAVAITDHHDTVMFRYVREAAESEKDEHGAVIPKERRIVVFPGMELSLALPCQALVIFDADIPLQHLDLLPGALGFAPPDPVAASAPQAQTLELGHPNDVEDRLNVQAPLRGRFIVLPHAKENGHKTIIRAGFHKHYARLRAVGAYVDGTVPAVGTGAHKILDGKDANYGNKALALFQTSDCRRSDFSTLGSSSTWVKWSRPSAEALRQSCLARHSRIRHSTPSNPAISIRRVEVSASKFLGKLDLFLNPQYNAVIGGRGTGKSTLLEYIRWGLCAPTSSFGEDDDSAPDFEKRTRAMIEKTLASVHGSVRIWVDVRGVEHVVDRRTAGQPEVQIKVGADPFRASSPEEVRRLVPIEAYRQKQLSSIGGKADDVLRFVLAPVAREATGLEDRLRREADHVRSSFADLRAKQRAAAEAEALIREQESLIKQREAVRGQIVGLDPRDAELLAKADLYARERSIAERWQGELASTKELIEKAVAACGALPSSAATEGLPDHGIVSEMATALGGVFEDVRQQLALAMAALSASGGFLRYQAAAKELQQALEVAREQFKKARERAQIHEAALKQIEALTLRIEGLDRRSQTLKQTTDGLATTEAEFAGATTAWASILAERADLTRKQCEDIRLASHELIRGTVEASADLSSAISLLSDVARGANIRGAKFDTLSAQVSGATQPLAAWLTLLDEVRALIGLAPEGPIPSVPTLRSSGLNDRELRALSSKLDEDAWIRLRLTAPGDSVRFEYRAREGDYIGFSDASAGQRATALMRVLLAQEGVPLVVDQPEDDLDNNVIHEIARDLWASKMRRQLVFASHNANLVVNGDADLIASFDYVVAGEATSGEVKAQGAIDDDSIRTAITSVMEGGRDAFSLRQAKYNF